MFIKEIIIIWKNKISVMPIHAQIFVEHLFFQATVSHSLINYWITYYYYRTTFSRPLGKVVLGLLIKWQ